MNISSKVYCFFEQSGTFKNEFKKLGIPSEDYDIQNNFGETDHVTDLFLEIEEAYEGRKSIFDDITKDDLIMAFFPCIYFTGSSNPLYFRLNCFNYKGLGLDEILDKMIERSQNRQYFYELIIKLVGVCLKMKIRLIIENPFSTQHYLHNNFFKEPTIIDKDRSIRGDFFKKPTGYWFFNCKNTIGFTIQKNRNTKIVRKCKSGIKSGICSEERSMISQDYARNFICDFILCKKQNINKQLELFND